MSKISIQEFIDNHRISSFQIMVMVLCFLVVAFDGFDTAAVGYIAPAIKSEWKLIPTQLSTLFGAGLFGLMAGAFLFGPLADKIGRRAVLIITTLFFGLATLASSTSGSIETFTLWRFVTGIGLGGAMPAAIALTSEYCPTKRRSSLVTAMFCGFTLGAASGGFAAASIIADHGWQSVLILGGMLPLVLVVVLVFALPESARYLVIRGGQPDKVNQLLSRVAPLENLHHVEFFDSSNHDRSPLKQLFSGDLLLGTIFLWLTFFMSLLVFYLLTSWLPTLLNAGGQSVKSSALYALVLPIGSTLGAIAIGQLMDRFNPRIVLAGSYFLAASFIVLLGFSTSVPALLLFAVFGAGVGSGGSQTGINALAASFYPTASRATGVSWANGVGRSGSIIGSMIGGYFLSFGWDLATVFAVAAIPALIASVAMLTNAVINLRKSTNNAELKAA